MLDLLTPLWILANPRNSSASNDFHFSVPTNMHASRQLEMPRNSGRALMCGSFLYSLCRQLTQARGLPASGLLQHTLLRCALGYGRTCLLQLSNCRPRLYRLRVLQRGTQLAMDRETEGASHGAIQLASISN